MKKSEKFDALSSFIVNEEPMKGSLLVVFKTTTTNVLNFDVNIALIAFCSLAVTKLARWPMSS